MTIETVANRESIELNIVSVLKNMRDQQPVLVTREPFDVEKIAVTQFPAILITSGNEERADLSMAISRTSTITYTIRGFVRGSDLDTKRNALIERIEESLEEDRTRGTNRRSTITLVRNIAVIDRLAPLAEVIITVDVRYTYSKGIN
jgi:hypothetical protein